MYCWEGHKPLQNGTQPGKQMGADVPVKVFAGGCTCGRKSSGTPWLGIKNSLKVDGLYRLTVALLGQTVTKLFCYWYHLKIFKPHTNLGESSREIYVLFTYFISSQMIVKIILYYYFEESPKKLMKT